MRAFLHAPRADQWSSSGHTAGYRMPCDPPNPAHPVTSTTRTAGSSGEKLSSPANSSFLICQTPNPRQQVEATSLFRPLDAAIKQSPKADMPAMMKRLALCAAALGSASAFAPMGGTALRPASLRAPVMRVTVTLVRAAPFAPRT